MDTYLRILILSTFGVFLWGLWHERKAPTRLEQVANSVALAIVYSMGLVVASGALLALKWALGF